ncbi:MAG: SAM-dependent methyltransferase [Phycisphaeraceae bacterium]|nr:SAM-dependent methyltransferase [Phycisphaeraceae bacterium]
MTRQDSIEFVKAFLRHPAKVGAVAPSSPALAQQMVRDLHVQAGQTLIEFGPGTGSFTTAILAALPAGASYLGIELDEKFVALLRRRFTQAEFVHSSAEHAARLHQDRQLPPVRAVLCGLPFASLPPTVQDAVIANLDQLLGIGAEFRTFQYVHAYPLPTAVRFRRRMSQLLGPCRRSAAVLRNLPPAYVLTWKRI